MTPTCPLCNSAGAVAFHQADAREYLRCPTCTLIFVHPEQRLGIEAERARYEEHENDAADEGYLDFLRRLAEPVMAGVPRGATGLDFGCGPTPALAMLMTEAGYPCAAYDPIFLPDEDLLEGRYDFVACSEVFEHLFDPRGTLRLLGRLLERGGLLGVMTRFYGHEAPFEQWWYRRDPTHVCFYSEPTMHWIATNHGWTVKIPRPHVAMFTIPPRPR